MDSGLIIGDASSDESPLNYPDSERSVMAFIPYVSREEAGAVLKKLYEAYDGEHGVVDNIVRVHSLNPRSMQDHVQLYAHLMRGPSPLTRIQREMLAVTVSSENDCYY
jgi:hypothetical protein